MLKIYSQFDRAERWIQQFQQQSPLFVCVLGFTETGLIPGISAAGATPTARQFTALADAEFLVQGAQAQPHYPLPPLQAGASPVLITRAVVQAQQIPVYLFNSGLPHPPSVPMIDLGGATADCVSQGRALDLALVRHLFQQGWQWGQKLAHQVGSGYLILSECVVGGTTTALAILTGLGWNAAGKVNSSHPHCNHTQKWQVVQAGLARFSAQMQIEKAAQDHDFSDYPFELVAAVGDPMQIVVAGMLLAASLQCGVLLAGGTQMLAVFALAEAIARVERLNWLPDQVVVGTTRWVAEDPTGDTVGLAALLKVPLLATQLSFAESRYAALRAYEQGYVKEGVGAGGAAIAAHLFQQWTQLQLLTAIEQVADQLDRAKLSDAAPG
jgi:uncharacterized protein (TIGR00303 family)